VTKAQYLSGAVVLITHIIETYTMLTYSPEIFYILERRFDQQQLQGYYGGKMNLDQTKFFAYTYVPLNSIDFEEFSHLLTSEGCSITGVDSEKLKKFIDERSYQMKSTEECIQEGLYSAYAIKFFGVYYEEEWFISNDLLFFGENMSEEAAKEYLSEYDDHPDRWYLGAFGKALSITIPGTDVPIRNVETEEFSELPRIVGDLKIEQKIKVNRAFAQYMNASVVHPFLKRMRIQFYEEFSQFLSLYGEDFTLVFPDSKIYFLVVAMARHVEKGYRLVWFFHDTTSGKFYRWAFPQPRFSEWSYHYAEDVIKDLINISDWNDYQFLNSSRTMDNQRFWAEYVLKKEHGRYIWLHEV
jgi:hypothetical protein